VELLDGDLRVWPHVDIDTLNVYIGTPLPDQQSDRPFTAASRPECGPSSLGSASVRKSVDWAPA
jgi:hypothetical protein